MERLSLTLLYGILALMGWFLLPQTGVGGSALALALSLTPILLFLSHFFRLDYLLQAQGVLVLSTFLLWGALAYREGGVGEALPALLGLSHLPLFFLRGAARGWARAGAGAVVVEAEASRERPLREADLEALEARVKARVIGQDHAVGALVKGLRRKAAGLTRKEKPFSAMLAGPTGTGKTELAKALAEALGRPLVRYDMNSYAQEHAVAALVGSPPGFVGSDRPGRLYEDLARHPEAVVLFDEMEKAHPRILDPLLQLLDEGRFQELSQGLVAHAPNAILLFTTNLLAREAFEGRGEIPDHLLRAQLVHMGLRPEFVNRLDAVVAFRPFGEEELLRLADLHVRAYLRRWQEAEGLRLEARVEEEVLKRVVGLCDTRFGARDLQRAIESLLGDPLAQAYLQHGGRPRRLEVRATERGVAVVLE